METPPQQIAYTIFGGREKDLESFPWGIPKEFWDHYCTLLPQLPKGESRHEVIFLKYSGRILAVKEMTAGSANEEYDLLCKIKDLRLPVVKPVGVIQLSPITLGVSYLVTQFLDHSMPFRFLFMEPNDNRFQQNLFDSIANLLVQLHLSGVFWGDCSLSNTLFKRDAGALQAYLVDAESSEVTSRKISPALRFQDLTIMDENITSEMLALSSLGYHLKASTIYDTGQSIRQSYHRLWEEVTREEVIQPNETYRIQEIIKKYNALGFSVHDIDLIPTEKGDKLRLMILVADRSFHRDQLRELTDLDAEEKQAQSLISEIQEIRATQSRETNQSIQIEAAAEFWQENCYTPVINRLSPLIQARIADDSEKSSGSIVDPNELYYQVLEHKWYLSERAKQDVGHIKAVDDYLQTQQN